MPTLAPKCFTKSYIQLLPAFAKLAFAQNDTALNRSATLWNIKCLHIIFGELSFSFWAILLFSVKPPTRDIHLGKFNIWTKMSGAFGIGINITERLNNFRLTLCCRGLAFSFYLTLCCFYALPIPLMDLHQMLHSTMTFGDDDDALRVWIILKRLNPSDGICHSWRLNRYCASSNRPNNVWISILQKQNSPAKHCWLMFGMNEASAEISSLTLSQVQA